MYVQILIIALLVIALMSPFIHVTGQNGGTSVRIGENVLTDYALETNGILHIFDVPMLSRKSKLTVEYTAGISDGMMDGIKELISNRVTHALASSAGIQSETAGGVSVTYSASWINSTRASALADDNKDALTPYRVQGVF